MALEPKIPTSAGNCRYRVQRNTVQICRICAFSAPDIIYKVTN